MGDLNIYIDIDIFVRKTIGILTVLESPEKREKIDF